MNLKTFQNEWASSNEEQFNEWKAENPDIEISFVSTSEGVSSGKYSNLRSCSLYVFYKNKNENLTLNS